jgi:hypothetical protein
LSSSAGSCKTLEDKKSEDEAKGKGERPEYKILWEESLLQDQRG